MTVEVQKENDMQKMRKALELAMLYISQLPEAHSIAYVKNGHAEMMFSCDVLHQIAETLSASPRKGKWENGTDYEYEFAYCSECGRMVFADWNSHAEARENVANFHEEYKYCPGCGAEMEGGVYVQ